MDSALAAQGALTVLLVVAALAFDPGLLLALLVDGRICVTVLLALKRLLRTSTSSRWRSGASACRCAASARQRARLVSRLLAGAFAAKSEAIR